MNFTMLAMMPDVNKEDANNGHISNHAEPMPIFPVYQSLNASATCI